MLVGQFQVVPTAEARQGDDGPNEFHAISLDQRRRLESGEGVLLLLGEDPAPKCGLGGMHGNGDLNRPVGGQFLEEYRVQHRGIRREAKRVVKELPTDEVKDLEEPWVQKGLPFGNAAGQAVAEPDGVVVGLHGAELELDVLDVPKETAGDREGVEVVGAEKAMRIADRADGKLIERAVCREPFEYEWAEGEGVISSPRGLGSRHRGRSDEAKIIRFYQFRCHCLTFGYL